MSLTLTLMLPDISHCCAPHLPLSSRPHTHPVVVPALIAITQTECGYGNSAKALLHEGHISRTPQATSGSDGEWMWVASDTPRIYSLLIKEKWKIVVKTKSMAPRQNSKTLLEIEGTTLFRLRHLANIIL